MALAVTHSTPADGTFSGTGSAAWDAAHTLTGTISTAQITDDAVTYAKLQNISATDRILGRDTAGAGDTEELTVSGGIEFTGSGGIQTSAFTGDVTKAAGGTATTIANDAVTDGKLRNSGALSVIGRSANSTGDPADISAVAASDAVLRESGSAVGFGTIATGGIANDAVTYAKIQNISATNRLLGRATAGAGDTEECTVGNGLEFSGTTLQTKVVYCAVSNSGSQSISNATTTAITFDTDTEDASGLHDTSSNTSRITVAIAGVYVITGAVYLETNSTGVRDVFFRLNGTTIIPAEFLVDAAATTSTGIASAAIIRLAANDYVELCVWQNSGGSLNSTTGNGQPIFRVARLGA